MGFLAYLFTAPYLLFTLSLIIAFGLALVVFVIGEIDDDYDYDVDNIGVLHYLGLGRIPIMVGIMTLLISFGISGFLVQMATSSLLFFLLPWWLAVFPAGAMAFVVTGKINSFIGKNIPAYENFSVDLSNLVGKTATITLTAGVGRIVEAKVIDDLAKTHYIRLKLSKDVSVNEVVTLVSYDSETNIFTHI